jgi:hypothetical protein
MKNVLVKRLITTGLIALLPFCFSAQSISLYLSDDTVTVNDQITITISGQVPDYSDYAELPYDPAWTVRNTKFIVQQCESNDVG